MIVCVCCQNHSLTSRKSYKEFREHIRTLYSHAGCNTKVLPTLSCSWILKVAIRNSNISSQLSEVFNKYVSSFRFQQNWLVSGLGIIVRITDYY